MTDTFFTDHPEVVAYILKHERRTDLTDEQLMAYVDAAFDFIERTTGALPGRTKQVQELLEVVGIHETLERIVRCGEIVYELKYKPAESEPAWSEEHNLLNEND